MTITKVSRTITNPCDVGGSQAEADAVAGMYATRFKALGQSLYEGKITLATFKQTMIDGIRLAFLHEAIAGTKDNDERELTMADHARLTSAIADQYTYLYGFTADIEDAQIKGMDIGFVPERAALYAKAAESQYWKQAVSIELPAMPRDGTSECLSNCQCSWDLQCDTPGEVKATWVLGAADHCDTCVKRSEEWNPLIIKVGSK